MKRELLRQHIQNTPRYKIQKYLYGFYLKILSKQKKTSWLTYEAVKGKKDVKLIQEPCHIFNEHSGSLTIIRKS